ncbi:MAG: hypothetical protein LBG59_03430 [Candidatus Peribacteria bacterium]|nr:hypothetical protein [Candidatus Peribacteria bacterium]
MEIAGSNPAGSGNLSLLFALWIENLKVISEKADLLRESVHFHQDNEHIPIINPQEIGLSDNLELLRKGIQLLILVEILLIRGLREMMEIQERG